MFTDHLKVRCGCLMVSHAQMSEGLIKKSLAKVLNSSTVDTYLLTVTMEINLGLRASLTQ